MVQIACDEPSNASERIIAIGFASKLLAEAARDLDQWRLYMDRVPKPITITWVDNTGKDESAESTGTNPWLPDEGMAGGVEGGAAAAEAKEPAAAGAESDDAWGAEWGSRTPAAVPVGGSPLSSPTGSAVGRVALAAALPPAGASAETIGGLWGRASGSLYLGGDWGCPSPGHHLASGQMVEGGAGPRHQRWWGFAAPASPLSCSDVPEVQ